MPVNSHHQEYAARLDDWMRVRDAIEGESAVKAKTEAYLPRPPGMRGNPRVLLEGGKRVANDRYDFYLGIAEFPEIIGPTLDGLQGLIHEKAMEVELPDQLGYLVIDATPDGETLQELWERITREVFSTGRLNLLHDIGEDDIVRFCTYTAENMINWRLLSKREGAAALFVVLRELVDAEGDDEFEVEQEVFYRELRLVDGVYWVRRWSQKDREKLQIVITDETDEEGWLVPSLFGRNLLSIPIDVINAKGEGFAYGPIPIMPMVRRAFSIYRKSADYNRSLYVKTDPQPVVYGVDEDELPDEIGGDSIWHFSNPDAKAELLDIDGLGIPLLRQAIEDEYQRFHEEGGRLRENDRGGAESGEALRRRESARHVTAKSLVINAGAQFEGAIKHLARTIGLSEDAIEKVKLKPNLDWAEPPIEPSEFDKLVDSKIKGAPLSWRTVHRQAHNRDLTDMTYEEEIDEIEKEAMDETGRVPAVQIDEEAEV